MHSSNGFLGLIKKFCSCSCVFFVFLNKYFRQYFKCKLQHKVLFNKKERGVGKRVVVVVAFVAFSASVKNVRTNVTTFNSFCGRGEGGKSYTYTHTH